MNAAIATGESQSYFCHNFNVCGLRDMLEVKKASSRKMLSDLESAAFDLVYIDGSHRKTTSCMVSSRRSSLSVMKE